MFHSRMTSMDSLSHAWNQFLNEENAPSSNFLRVTLPYYSTTALLANKFYIHLQGEILVSSNFQWWLNYQQASSKAYKILDLLRGAFFSSVSTRTMLTLSFALSYSTALLSVSSSTGRYNMSEIGSEKLLNSFLRVQTRTIGSV